MAAYCPKCNYKLRIRDWRAECPACGVNILYYGIEDRLREEADLAEYHHALRQPGVDRLKFSLIGHPLSIVRLVLGLLPIVCTLLPMGTVEYVLPYGVHKSTVNLVSIIQFFVAHGFDFNLIQKLFQSEVIGKGMLYWFIALACLLVTLVVTLVGFFLLTLSASPRGRQRNFVFPIIGVVGATAAFICYVLMIHTLTDALPGIFTGTVNPLAYIAMLMCYAALIAVNVVFKAKDIQVKYTDVSELLLPYNERPSTIEKKNAKATGEAAAPEAAAAQS